MKKFCLLFLLAGALLLIGTTKGAGFDPSENEEKSGEPTVLASFKLVTPLPKVPENMMVYRTVDPKISREDVMRLMKAFDLEGRVDEREKQFLVKTGDRVLELFKEPGTGYIRFSDNARLTMEEEAENLPSEEEAVKRAQDFLKKNGLLPDNTAFRGVRYYEFATYDSIGKTTSEGKSGLAVGFGFQIEGIKVEGPGAKAGVVFGRDGQIIGASRIWREIRPDKEMKIINPEEAFSIFKQRWPMEGAPEELPRAEIRTEVNISEVYVAYYAEPGCIPQSHVEPVYLFKGNYQTSGRVGEREIKESDYFEIMIPAVPK